MQSHDGFGSTLSSAISPLIPNSSRTSCQKWTCKKQTITVFFSSESFHLDANFCLHQAILFFLWTFCKGIMCVTMVLSVISLSYNCLSMSTLMFVFKPKVSKTNTCSPNYYLYNKILYQRRLKKKTSITCGKVICS